MNAQSSDEEIQRAVAEELGWVRKDESYPFRGSICKSIVWYDPKGVPQPLGDGILPKFHLSIDACVEFEKDAPPVYWTALIELLGADEKSALGMAIAVARATPRQRCIAYLQFRGIIK